MKANLNKPLMDFQTDQPVLRDGKPQSETHKPTPENPVLLLRDLVIEALLTDTEEDKNASATDKFNRFSLAMYIKQSSKHEDDEIQLSAEDIVLIKARAVMTLRTYPCGIIMQAIDPASAKLSKTKSAE